MSLKVVKDNECSVSPAPSSPVGFITSAFQSQLSKRTQIRFRPLQQFAISPFSQLPAFETQRLCPSVRPVCLKSLLIFGWSQANCAHSSRKTDHLAPHDRICQLNAGIPSLLHGFRAIPQLHNVQFTWPGQADDSHIRSDSDNLTFASLSGPIDSLLPSSAYALPHVPSTSRHCLLPAKLILAVLSIAQTLLFLGQFACILYHFALKGLICS
ncbi:unnamed protein product [Protopolystoma xenopodis]|uniref:Uncharacterized protein n=1 Tax=Protopolystoma xenopodis TaxID=117903 RepID=A0A448XQ42_9PLAT|nr:unnamed protein product [Protopolystoma xenopodis]